MPAPYNYASQLGNPMESFMGGLQVANALQQQYAAAEQAKQAQARQAELQQAMAAWQQDRSPEATADMLLRFPEMKEAITSSQGVLDTAAKEQNTAFAVDVFGLLKGGMTEQAISRMEERIAGLKNTRGREHEARAAEYLLEQVRKDPNIALNTASLYLGAVAPDVYKNVVGTAEMTGFQKNLAAAGIDPNSQEGLAMARSFAENQADPLVEIETPGGAKFVGPRSEYFRRYGEGAPAPSRIAAPKSRAEYDALPPGTAYRAPTGEVLTKGGPVQSAPGNFPSGRQR
jgi:hypothetical protein